jgi:hypothetical protein
MADASDPPRFGRFVTTHYSFNDTKPGWDVRDLVFRRGDGACAALL